MYETKINKYKFLKIVVELVELKQYGDYMRKNKKHGKGK